MNLLTHWDGEIIDDEDDDQQQQPPLSSGQRPRVAESDVDDEEEDEEEEADIYDDDEDTRDKDGGEYKSTSISALKIKKKPREVREGSDHEEEGRIKKLVPSTTHVSAHEANSKRTPL